MLSTRRTSSLVSRAISKAIGGNDWVHCLQILSPSSSSLASSAISLPSSLALTSRCLTLDSFRNIGSAWVLNVELLVEDIAVSVEETTLPTTVAMEFIWFVIADMPASERMDETSD